MTLTEQIQHEKELYEKFRKLAGKRDAKADEIDKALEEVREHIERVRSKRQDAQKEGDEELADALAHKIDALEQQKDELLDRLDQVEDNSEKAKHLRAEHKQRTTQLRKRREEQHAEDEPNFNGHPSNVSDDVKDIIVRANKAGLVVTSTTDGSSHATTSYHYPRNNASGLGEAVDLGGTWETMVKFQNELANEASGYREVFGPDNDACVKNGQRIAIGEGTALEQAHDNHIHVAPN